MLHETCQTNNEAWGFWGTIRHHNRSRRSLADRDARRSGKRPAAPIPVRDFLDSRHGRQFADDVANGLFKGLALPAAIAATVELWMSWRIGRHLSRETGIPHGLPYLLLGLVTDCEIIAEVAA